jgi:hypothetical protein
MTRDENGVLVFQPEGEVSKDYHASGKSAMTQDGWLYTDDGIPVAASTNRDISEPGFDTNCHGYTFGDGQYWINPDQVPKILEGDDYENILDPKAGDIVVYYENRKAIHSAKVVDVRKKYGLFGFSMGTSCKS